jgi:Ca-activated chloride channel homolog
MTMWRWLAIAATAACVAGLFVPGVRAQQGRFRTSVNTVPVYATVSDGDGRLVLNLGKEDFTILDNGVPREITLFSSELQPITVVIMLDMSGSMLSRFIKLRASTEWFVEALLPHDRAQIGTFGDEIAISPLLTGDKQVLRRVLRDELWPTGGTPLWTALDGAMTALANESGRRVVLAITDGRDSCNLPRCLKAKDIERRAVREGFMVYAIGMDGTGLDGDILRISEETGGGHFALAPEADLTATFAQVAEQLRRQYVLGFNPESLDGKLHALEVRVANSRMKVRARRNYFAARK